jgi:DNA-binding IclR family transcriptional regulator
VRNEATASVERPRLRGLSTARAVLQVLVLLARSPAGLRADAAAEALGKSVSTAYNLLDSLCEEGFAVHGEHGCYQLADPAQALLSAEAAATHPRPLAGLAHVLDELFARTHKRAYIAAAHGGRIVIPLVRGRQGIRRIPGLEGEIRSNLHALALGKVVLSLQDPQSLRAYVAEGLTAFTPHTILDPEVLVDELDEVRRSGVASDCEEFGEDFCCLAAPVFDARRRAVAVLGISMSARSFELERERLTGVLVEVAEAAGRGLPPPSDPNDAGRVGAFLSDPDHGAYVRGANPETEVSA